MNFSPRALEIVQAAIALALLLASLGCVPRAYLAALDSFRRGNAVDRGILVAALVAGAVLRLAVFPRRLAMIYIGYHQTQQTIDLLPLSHYGAGAAVFYHVLFAVLPRDHLTIMWVNSVIGVLSLPLLAAFAARLLDDRRAGALAALAVALTPLFIRNDNSEANNVPALWWTLSGLLLWYGYLDTRTRGALALALTLLTLAAVSRPEMPLLVIVLVALATLAEGARLDRRDPALVVGLGVSALLVVPHLLHALNAVRVFERTGTSLSFGLLDVLARGPSAFLGVNVILEPRLYPAGLLLLGLGALGLGDRERRRRRLLLAAATPLVLALYAVDLDRGNMGRVEVPEALLWTILAASGTTVLWHRARRPPVRALGALALALSFAGTIPLVFAMTNEEVEDAFIRELLPLLPEGPFTLVRMGYDDMDRSGDGFTQHHFPDYLLSSGGRSGRAMSVGEWAAHPDHDEPVFFHLGTRCYSRFRHDGVPPPHGDNLQTACARMRSDFRLAPVVERVVKNHGDVWLNYYGDAPTLKLGLYRVETR